MQRRKRLLKVVDNRKHCYGYRNTQWVSRQPLTDFLEEMSSYSRLVRSKHANVACAVLVPSMRPLRDLNVLNSLSINSLLLTAHRRCAQSDAKPVASTSRRLFPRHNTLLFQFVVAVVQCKVAHRLGRRPALSSQLFAGINHTLRRPPMVHPQHEMLALQQQQALLAAAQGMNPLALFPQMVNNNNKLTANMLDGKQSDYKAPKLESADSLDNVCSRTDRGRHITADARAAPTGHGDPPESQHEEVRNRILHTQLAGIERAEEKLAVMVHAASFEESINAISEQLESYSTAAKLVQESEQLRMILQAILALINHLNGTSLDEKVVGGFCTSQVAEQLESYSTAAKLVQESEQLRMILQAILALINHLNGTSLDEKVVGGFCTSQVAEVCSAQLSDVPFLAIYGALLRLDEGNQRVQHELEQLDFEHPVLADQLLVMLSYMGEALPRTESDFRPEVYLSKLCDFLASLRLQNESDVEVEN
ncbi:unnamed protein product [Nippostrongylus brasiliensis]|uniref:Formin-homology and zinc finger domains protein 1 (inferred by orthology to a C. elegans protein) n=2 Tax=Nippostrongylus brasiliensis TaxID=27835 RepID=A0A0N4YRI1_NIPBR|nr:unnamed protein product [Nippostrongylus brasiliensis]